MSADQRRQEGPSSSETTDRQSQVRVQTQADAAGPEAEDPAANRVVTGRPANACIRCRTRKTKCTCERPACIACIKAKVDCEYQEKSATLPTLQYVQRLEAQLRALEGGEQRPAKRRQTMSSVATSRPADNVAEGSYSGNARTIPMSPATSAHSRTHPSPRQYDQSRAHPSPQQYDQSRHTLHSQAQPSTSVHSLPHTSPQQHDQFRSYPSIVSLSHPPFSGPPYRHEGYSDGRPSPSHHRLAPPSSSQLFDRLPSAADLDQVVLEASDEDYAGGSGRDGSRERFSPDALSISELPPRSDMDEALSFFLTQVNTAFPILHEPTLCSQLTKLYESRGSQEDAFVAYTILAIWWTAKSRDGRNTNHTARSNEYWSQSQRYYPAVWSKSGLPKLQAMHLVLQYVLRRPDTGDIWELTGNAVRTAFDLGLHLDAEGTSKHSYTPLQLDMRRRLFWATYCLDHKIAVALGRPPGIVSDWISARFPSLLGDEHIHSNPPPNTPSYHRKESVIHHIRLRILQAEIYQRLFTVAASKTTPPTAEWFVATSQRLDQWRFGYVSEPDELLTPRWLDLHFNLSRLLLFRPNPGNPTPDQESLKRALASSSFLMRTYKSMWRLKTVNFVWLAIHHVFVAGVTYLNALWVAAKHDWEIVPSLIDAMLDIQSCSQVLEGMTESQHGTARIRDAFEVVSAAVIRRLSAMPKKQNSDDTSNPPAGTTNGALNPSTSQYLPPTLSGTSQMQMLPWMSWPVDPSRPASPTAAIGAAQQTDNSLADFFFHPFAAIPSLNDFVFNFNDQAPGADGQGGAQPGVNTMDQGSLGW